LGAHQHTLQSFINMFKADI